MATSNSTDSSSTDGFVPIIDFSSFSGPSVDSNARLSTAKAILHAFQTSGFIYLTHHGISPDEVTRMFSVSAKFFARPQPEKDALEWDCPESNRGYTCMGREKVSQELDTAAVAEVRAAEGQDLKESFEIGRNDEAGHPNQWPVTSRAPEEDSEFKEESLKFFARCKQVHVELMRALALGLGIEEHWFDDFTSVGDNTLRLLHYPAVERSVFRQNKLQLRAGAHSDYGSVTLLFQDDRGGLQACTPDGTFVDVKPIKDALVVNAGDLLARWSNDLVKSTIHRVVEPPLHKGESSAALADANGDTEVHPPRYSIAYFCNPDFHKLIETIPNTVSSGDSMKYESINSGVYLAQRLAASY